MIQASNPMAKNAMKRAPPLPWRALIGSHRGAVDEARDIAAKLLQTGFVQVDPVPCIVISHPFAQSPEPASFRLRGPSLDLSAFIGGS
jgi:hypothetical protein